jgi:hypothetical protein
MAMVKKIFMRYLTKLVLVTMEAKEEKATTVVDFTREVKEEKDQRDDTTMNTKKSASKWICDKIQNTPLLLLEGTGI